MSDDNYAGQRSGDNYVDNKGNIHQFRSDAEAVNNSGGGGGVTDAGGNILMAVLIPFIIVGVLAFILQTLIKQYAFYLLPVAGFFILRAIVTKVVPRLFGIGKGPVPVLVLLAAALGVILFGRFIYYPNVIEPSPFTADYLISEAAIHAGRNGGGKELAVVAEGERVTVNGITRDRAEFNITAKDGSTGWIPAAAFPEDATIPPDDIGGLMKSRIPIIGRNAQRELSRDVLKSGRRTGERDWRNRIEAVAGYFVSDPSVTTGDHDSRITWPDTEDANKFDDVWPWLQFVYGLTGDMMNRAVQVNQPFTVTINASTSKTNVFSGDVEMALWYVLYAPEATIAAVNLGEHEWNWAFYVNDDDDFFNSLVIKDLDTGETFPLYDYIDSNGGGKELFLIFPPVATRHFALVHEKPSVAGKEGADTAVWDIPEITLAANAPTMASDPYVVTQRRIADFTGNGSNAMTTQQEALYSEASITSSGDREPLTLIPPGEIVTILKERPPTSPYIKVRYKDFEGYVGYRFLKQ